MTRSRARASLGTPDAQRIGRPRSPLATQSTGATVGLASQWLGPRMPARKAAVPAQAILLQQTEPPAVIELTQRRKAYLQQTASDADVMRRNKEILALLDEWMREPDELGEDWWSTFDKELEAQRFRIPERE